MALQERLTAQGVRLVAGWATNGSNLVHAKTVPVARTVAFVDSGAGMSPVYNGYSLDATIQHTRYFDAVGDLRLRLDPDAVRVVGGGLAVGPADAMRQDGDPDPSCPRGILRRVVSELRRHGLEAQVGHELEFVLVAPDGTALTAASWTPYGLGGILDRQELLVELAEACDDVGLALEQVHAEYGEHQLEVSLPPAGPVEAADAVVLAKTVIGQVTRRHGVRASFAPVPFPGSVGSGAHQHFSLVREGVSLFAGGPGVRGMQVEGEQAVAGVLHGLCEAQAMLTGSVLSGLRLAPGMWSGASVCWGTENREAAVRFLEGPPANPHGANVEVKVVDPSANPYLASATVLGLALDGIRQGRPLPEEVTADPSSMTEPERERRGIALLRTDQRAMLDALDRSDLMRSILGDPAVEATLAVRRHEADVYGALDPDEVAAHTRLAWTI